ncbi:MAG: toprim domain-containing protein [Candidatus Altiarchaeota archaeon]
MESRLDLLPEFLESLGKPIIVEGRKDREALERLGVSEPVVELNRGASLLDVVEALQEYDEVIVLTDMDQQGKILRKKLHKLFNLYGIREDVRPREIFARMRFSHVEGLDSMVD